MKTLILLQLIFGFYKYNSVQNYLLPNEKIIFAFTSENNKKMVLARDSTNKYIVYRFGDNDKIEFEFPEKVKNSWNKFTYSFYLRGGGKQNEGLDLNYVYFIRGSFKYIIYHTYSAVEEKSKCGIKVVDTTINKMVDIGGNINTIEGNLTDFRDNNLLQIGEGIFD